MANKKKKNQDTSPLAMGRQQRGSAANKRQTGSNKGSQSSVSPSDRIKQKTYGTTTPSVTRSTSGSSSTPSTQQRQQNRDANLNLKQTQAQANRQRLEEDRKQREAESKARRGLQTSMQKKTDPLGINEANKVENRYNKNNTKTAATSEEMMKQRAQDKVDARNQKSGTMTESLKAKQEKNKAKMQETAAGRIVGNAADRWVNTEKRILTETGVALSDIGEMASKGKTNPNGRLAQDMGDLLPDREKRRRQYQESYNDLSKKREKLENKGADLTKGAKGFEKTYYSAEESGIGMLSDFILGQAVGGRWEIPLALRSYGAQRGKAQLEGATTTEDRLNAAKDSIVEIATEKIGGFMGAAKLAPGKKMAKKFSDRIAGNLAKKLEGKAGRDILAGAGRLARNAIEENIEEWIANPAEAFGENVIFRNRVQSEREAENDAYFKELGTTIQEYFNENPDTVEQYIAELNSEETRDELLQDYIDAGMTEEQANNVTDKMLDFMEAAARNDVEQMNSIKESLDDDLVGDMRKKVWDWNENLESFASTTLLMMTTGLPGAVSTTMMGKAIKDTEGSRDAMMNALRKTIAFDPENSSKAQSLLDSMEDGYEPTATQAYDIMADENAVMAKTQEAQRAKEDAANNRMRKEDLRIDVSETNPDGSYTIVGKTTAEQYDNDYADTMDFVEAANGYWQNDQMDAADADFVATAVASFKAGTLTAAETSALTVDNPEARYVFEMMTGIDLNDYNVTDRKGNINAAASNVNMQQHLFALAADNYVQSARNEQAAWNDEVRGQAAAALNQSIGTNEIGPRPNVAYDALMSVDPRDQAAFRTTGIVAQNIYDHAWNTQDSWEDVKKAYSKQYKSVDVDALKGVYEQAKTDRAKQETPYYGSKVTAGESIKKIEGEEQGVVRGRFINTTPYDPETDTGRDPGLEELAIYDSIASNLEYDVVMVDPKDERLKTVDPNTKKSIYGNAVVHLSDGVIYISNASDPAKIIHEATHIGAKYASDAYLEMAHFIMDRAYKVDSEGTQALIEKYRKLYKGQKLSDVQIEEEVVADLVSVYMTDEEFVRGLAHDDPTGFRKIIRAIENFIRKLRNILASGHITDLEMQDTFLSEIGALDDVRKMWLRMYDEASKNRADQAINDWQDAVNEESGSDVRHSISDSEIERIKAKKRTNKADRQMLRDAGEKLSESDFYKLYSAHKLDLRNNGNVEAQVESIKRNGFMGDAGFGINTMPASINNISRFTIEERRQQLKDFGIYTDEQIEESIANLRENPGNGFWSDDVYFPEANYPQRRYGGRKGDTVLLVPEHHVYRDERVVNGFKPFDYEVVKVERDFQPYYELYSQAYNDYNGTSITEEQREELNTDGIEELDDGTTARFSLTSWEATDKNKKLKALTDAGHSEKKANKWIDDINSIASVILADPDRLDYEADPARSFKKDNGDYYMYTLDASTLCDKRRIYQGTYDAIQHAMPNAPLLDKDVIRLRTMLKEFGYKSPCGICYVESQRKILGQYAKEWYDNYERKDEIKLDDVTTSNGLKALKKTNPQIAQDFEAAMNAKGVQSPKVVELRTDYRDNLAGGGMRAATVEKLNKRGGLRFHSFSDFETPHLIDTMQAVLDMSAKGLMGMAYTKVPNFVAVFGPTGIKINMSLIAKTDENGNAVYDKNGRLVFDDVEGIPYEEAAKWRDAYPNDVAFILVGKDKEHTLAALKDDRIDFVIPFHRSKWSEEDMKRLGLIGYEDFATGHQENGIFASDFWKYNKTGKENAEAYLKLCKEKEVTPVFEQLLVDNGDGSYSLQPDGSTDNYWKLLVEGKMYNHLTGKGAKQKVVKPDFNMEEANRVLNEYEGGADTLPVADDVVAAFVKEYVEAHPGTEVADVKYSLAAKYDEPYMFAVNSGNMEEAQRLVDEAARSAGYDTPKLYHGTPSFGFTEFDLSKGENIIFATSSRLTAETYSGGTERERISDASKINVDELYGDDLLSEASKHREKYKDYRLMSPAEQESLLEESREDIKRFAQKASDFVDDHKDAFNGEKLEIANRIVDALNRISTAWADDMVDSAWNDFEDAVWDLKWMDETIQMELSKELQENGSLLFAKNRVSDFMYAGDLYRHKDYESDYVFDNQLALELGADLGKGIYGLYGRTDNQLVIDAEGSNWNQIKPPEELKLYGPQKTRWIAEAAMKKGYDSVLFKNLRDNGGETAYNGESDVYMFFNPSQVKSADPVTYAEDGSVIPLSERFNPNNDDIRYSLPTQDSDNNILSDGQMEYFKNSQARDEQGRLVPVYHGTQNGGFTIFDSRYGISSRYFFFVDKLSAAEGYSGTEEMFSEAMAGEEDVRLNYKVYLDMVNPLIVDAQGHAWVDIPYEDDFVTTNWLAEYAEQEGYDGVIVKNVIDRGSADTEYAPQTDYIVFNSNQIKDVNNLNPSENPDIRYSIVDDEEDKSRIAYADAMDDSYEALERYEQLIDLVDPETYNIPAFQEENVAKFYASLKADEAVVYDDPVLEEDRVRIAKSKADFYSSLNAKWQDRWTTGGEVLDVKSVKKDIRNLVIGVMNNSDTTAKYRNEIVKKTLMDVRTAFQLMKQDRPEIASYLLYHSAQRMIDNVEFYTDDTFDMYKDLKHYLRTTRISIGEEYWSDVDYNAFRRRNFGRLKLVKGPTNVDEVYQELQEKYPEWFNEDETMSVPDQLLEIEHVLDSIQPYKEAYSSEAAAELAFDIADELYDIMAGGKEIRSLADTYKERYDAKTKAMKQRHAEAMLRMRKARDEGIQEERRKFREYKEQQKTKKEHKYRFGHILEDYNKLCKWVLDPTKDKNVPEEFRKSLAEFLQTLDLQTENSKKLEEKTGHVAHKTFKMRELKDRLNDLAMRKNDEEGAGTSLFEIDANVAYLLDSLANKLEKNGNTVDALGPQEILEVEVIFKSIIRNIQRYKQVRLETKQAEISDIGDRAADFFVDKVKRDGEAKEYKGARDWLHTINVTSLTPAYLFDRMGPLKEMYDVLRHNGFDTYIRNEAKIIDKLSEILGQYYKGTAKKPRPGSEIEAWRDDRSAQTIELSNGSVTMSVAQMMSLYCLGKRSQATQHMKTGGIIITPIQTGSKIEAAKERYKGKESVTQRIIITDADLKTIETKLTKDQIKVADALQQLMAVDMSKLGNEAHRELYGYEIFNDPDYFPIKVHGTEISTDINNIGQVVEKIKSYGPAKPLVPNASNIIEVDDIFSVVADHCNGMNLYASYLVPVTDFMKVLNYKRTYDNGDSITMKEAIKQAYGEDVLNYIMNMMMDINGIKQNTRGGLESIMNKALGTAKKTAVFGNIRVALQQPTAVVRALAEVDTKYFTPFLNVAPEKGVKEEMYKYCPIAQWKSWGYYDTYMGRDIEDVMMNNWSRADVAFAGIYGELDNWTWSLIWRAVKAEMKDKHPEMDAKSEEFLQLCGRRASEVFDKTQVVDSTFHRSDAMRSKQVAAKAFTAFMSEPTLTLNVFRAGLYHAAEELKAGHRGAAVKILQRTATVIFLQAIIVSAAQAFADAWRGKNPGLPWDDDDDDDEENAGYWTRWLNNFVYNVFDQLHLENNMYLVKDVSPYINYMMSKAADFYNWDPTLRAVMGWDQDYLYSQNNLIFAALENTANGVAQIFKKMEKGEDYDKDWYDIIQKTLSGIGTFTGIPIGTLMRDTKPIWEAILGVTFADDGTLMEKVTKTKRADSGGKSDASKGTKNGKESSEGEEVSDDEALKKLEEKARKKAAGLSGDELDEALWDVLSEGYTKKLDNADMDYIEHLELIYMNCGGDTSKFEARIKDRIDSAYKKTLKEEMTTEDLDNQYTMRLYMQKYGYTDEEISATVYDTATRSDLQAAMRMGNQKYIAEETEKLMLAGMTEADFEKAYKNRNRGRNSYKGKYTDKKYLKSTGTYIWPVSGPITSEFGYRNAPTAGASTNHPAIDIGAAFGTPVSAADGGTVISVGWNDGYGKQVAVRSDDGKTVLYYSHLSYWDVNEGDYISQGQQIGQVGSTGNSTGPHLDFKVEVNGEPVNPMQYLSQDKVDYALDA